MSSFPTGYPSITDLPDNRDIYSRAERLGYDCDPNSFTDGQDQTFNLCENGDYVLTDATRAEVETFLTTCIDQHLTQLA